MSKYDPLWRWIAYNGTDSFQLTYQQINDICGMPIDHSFLTYKKELLGYGFTVDKISIKKQVVFFTKVK